MIRAPFAERLDAIPARWAAARPGAVALRDPRQARTWRELEAARGALAASLAQRGVRAGDRVMIVGENCAVMPALFFALSTLHAWIVNVNARLTAPEVEAIRAHCQPRLVLYLTDDSVEAASHAARHGAAAMDSAGWGAIGCSAADRAAVPEPAAVAAEVAALVYTTGTTGTPKAVMLTHANLLFIARAAVSLRGIAPADRVLGMLPLSHVYGLASVCLGSLLAGACVDLHARFTPAALERALADDGVTLCQGVPAMYAKFLQHLAAAGSPVRAPRLRAIYCGGAPLAAAVKAAVEAAFALPLHNGYGLTEASPTVAQTRHEAPRRDCSVGPALPQVELKLVAGELWVRGPNVMKGYYRDPAATAQALRPGGWLATGDLARIDADGAVHIEGRLKELIIRSGFNVLPAEVEAVLNAHPAVSQSAVVGREAGGDEEIVAFVELVPGACVDAAALLAHAAAALAPYKRPAQVVLMEKLPAAASGKVLKGRLRELARASVRPAAPAG